jgi:hypothetical protein
MPLSGLRVMVYPYADHVVWSLMRINFHGVTTSQGRLASGSIPLKDLELEGVTARRILQLVLDQLPPAPAPPAPPLGDMGEQLSLDLDLRP